MTTTVIYRVCGRPGVNDRPPLPSGSSETWELITRGTVLDRTEYPFPVRDQPSRPQEQGNRGYD